MSGTREENIFFAQLSEQAGRYDDMTHYMTAIANMGKPLDSSERNLLSVAFKNSVASRRQAYRHVSVLSGDPGIGHVISDYRQQLQAELDAKCSEILDVLTNKLIPVHGDSDVEGAVFYAKMQGDYYRYKAEFLSAEGKQAAVEGARSSYDSAMEKAQSLPTTSSVRLGLALNISVFYYEVCGAADEARNLAKQTYDSAMQEIDSLDEQQQQEAFGIMQLLSDNLQQWKGDNMDGTEIQDM